MTVVSARADLAEAARRINAGTASLGIESPPLNADTLAGCVEKGDILIIVNADNVLLAHYDDFVKPDNPSPAWWVNPVYGSATFWRTLFKELSLELVRRGHGDTPVRWTPSGAVSAFTRKLFKINGVSYIEYTANKALKVLP